MKKEMTVKNEDSNSFSVKARLKSFRYAFAGLLIFFRTQHNAIIHLVITILVLTASMLFDVSKSEIIAITLATSFVWVAELFNTAIEKLADMVSKDFHPQIKFIKDVSAAAVLISAIVASITGVIIFLPKLLS